MSTPHLEIEGPDSRRRTPLTGPLVLAGGGADAPLSGAGAGALRWVPREAGWLVEWLPEGAQGTADGAPPRFNGRDWSGAQAPVDGDRIEWGAVRIVFRAAADSGPARAKAGLEELELENLDVAAPVAGAQPVELPAGDPALAVPSGVLRTARERAWRRVWSGLLVEQGLVPASAARAVQEDVRRREFDADLGADQILDAERAAEADQRILDRARALQRDLLMAPLNTGARRAVRKARNRARSGLAYLTAQFVTLAVYSFLVLVALVLLRHRGLDLNGLLDNLLGLFSGGGG